MIGDGLILPAAALVLVGVFGQTVSGWTRRVDPAVGARLLLVMSGIASGVLGATLVSLALPLIGLNDWLADYARWPENVFGRGSGAGRTIAGAAAVAGSLLLCRVGRSVVGQWRADRSARSIASRLGVAHDEVVVLPIDDPDGMAIAGGPIVLTRGLVRALDPAQRRAVLAHERSHIRHRHHRYIRLAMLLSAANPLLRRVPNAILYLTERWADEDAAQATSRATTASALRQAALGAGRPMTGYAVLRVAAVAVEQRIQALLEDPPALEPSTLLTPILLTVLPLGITSVLTERVVDVVQSGVPLGPF